MISDGIEFKRVYDPTRGVVDSDDEDGDDEDADEENSDEEDGEGDIINDKDSDEDE